MALIRRWYCVKLLILGTGDIAKRMLENGLNGELIGFVETKKERKCLGTANIKCQGNSSIG